VRGRLIHRKREPALAWESAPMHAQVSFPRPGGSSRKVVDLLGHAPIFRDLSPDELARIASGTTEVRAERGKVLIQRGDPCIGFHLVVFGQVKLVVGTASGAEKVVEIIGPGMTFGEALMFADRPYVVSAVTLADCFLLHVGKEALYAELDRDPRLARRMLAGLSMRLHMMVKDVEALALHSAMQRVIGYLAMLEESGAEGRVTLPAQKSLVASRLNLTAEYFSRILHELAAAGLVRVDGRDIEILDSQGLRAFGTEADSG
jgi:CRP-like cAMP-binding protein